MKTNVALVVLGVLFAGLMGFALVVISERPMSHEEVYKAYCARLVECFPKASYGGCMMYGVAHDDPKENLSELAQVTKMSCNEFDFELIRHGVSMQGLK